MHYRRLVIIYSDRQHVSRTRRDGRTARYVHVLRVCDDCGDRKYVAKSNADRMIEPHRCADCRQKVHGPEHGNWKGGRQHRGEYVFTTIYPSDPLYEMGIKTRTNRATGGRLIAEHRLVAARALGRALVSHEIVHHRNSKKDDNRPENLEVTTTQRNVSYGVLEKRIYELERHIAKCCGHSLNKIEN